MTERVSRLRKSIRKVGAGIFWAAAAGSLGLGICNWIMTWGKSAGDFQYSVSTLDGGFVWDSAVFTGVWTGVVLMMIGLGIYAATFKAGEL